MQQPTLRVIALNDVKARFAVQHHKYVAFPPTDDLTSMGIDYNIRFDNPINGGVKAYTCGCVTRSGQKSETQPDYNGHMIQAAKDSELYQQGVSKLR
jgi:hypothetical protein